MGPENPVIDSFQLLQHPLKLHEVWLTPPSKHGKTSLFPFFNCLCNLFPLTVTFSVPSSGSLATQYHIMANTVSITNWDINLTEQYTN